MKRSPEKPGERKRTDEPTAARSAKGCPFLLWTERAEGGSFGQPLFFLLWTERAEGGSFGQPPDKRRWRGSISGAGGPHWVRQSLANAIGLEIWPHWEVAVQLD